MYTLRIKTTRLGVASGDHFLAVMRTYPTEKDPRSGWVLQPCVRVRRGSWHCERPIAGPFRTRKLANEAKKFLESIDWRHSMTWFPSREEG